MNMLLSLEPLIYLESITNGKKDLKITSGGFRLILSAYDDPWHGGKLIPCDHLLTPYAYGIHELFYDCACAVDMYVSY